MEVEKKVECAGPEKHVPVSASDKWCYTIDLRDEDDDKYRATSSEDEGEAWQVLGTPRPVERQQDHRPGLGEDGFSKDLFSIVNIVATPHTAPEVLRDTLGKLGYEVKEGDVKIESVLATFLKTETKRIQFRAQADVLAQIHELLDAKDFAEQLSKKNGAAFGTSQTIFIGKNLTKRGVVRSCFLLEASLAMRGRFGFEVDFSDDYLTIEDDTDLEKGKRSGCPGEMWLG